MKLSAESRRVILLGLIALVLGSYTYLSAPASRPLSGPQAATDRERPALNFTAEEVSRIELVYNQQHLVCQRSQDGWQVAATGGAVRPAAVQDFLTNLGKLLHLGNVEGIQDELAEYGLKPPQASIILQLNGQETRRLQIGTRNPVQSSLYAQINDAPQVVLVGAVVLWDIRKLFTAANQAQS